MENIFRRLRKENGFKTQEEAAKVFNVSRSSVAKWELGLLLPDARKLKEISRVYNCTTDELLSTIDTPADPPPEEAAL